MDQGADLSKDHPSHQNPSCKFSVSNRWVCWGCSLMRNIWVLGVILQLSIWVGLCFLFGLFVEFRWEA